MKLSSAAFILLGLTSCTSITTINPVGKVDVRAPDSWSAASLNSNRVSKAWLREFRSPRMNRLVNEALANNLNLKELAANLAASQENTIIARARRLPTVDASTSYSRRDAKRIPTTEQYNISIGTSWEIDLWGRLRDLQQAALADDAANRANYHNARLSLAATTARAWCNLVTAERQLDLARRTRASYEEALPVVERRYKANTLRAVDVQFARNNVANASRTLEARLLSRNNAARNLETLLGRYPSAEIQSSLELPHLSHRIPAGLPASLLERRPDLQAARARLQASALDAQAAQKNLLPALRLTGSASNGADSIRRAFDPNFLLYSIASSLSQSIYTGGRLKAQARQALARNRAEIHAYTDLALNAFREVETALNIDTSLTRQETFLEQEVRQTTLAEKRALSDITLGIEGSSFLEYLEAQRRAENARASLIRLRNERLQNRIDLHLALGGGF